MAAQSSLVHKAELVESRIEKYEGLTMAMSPAEAKRRLQELQAFVADAMVEGQDYGTIPGTDKPTLYQPGAQKLAEIYGFSADFDDDKSIQDWDKPFFLFRKRCVLTSRRDGRFVGTGIGSCNSREDKYAWRWVWSNEVPKGFDISGLKRKSGSKNGKEWTKYRIPNDDVFSVVNTIEKMACKRAYVHAVISVTRSAGIFTQDAEDLPAEAFGQVDETRSWEEDKTEKVDHYATLAGRIATAKTVQDLNAVARELSIAHKTGKISNEQREEIGKLGQEKKAALGIKPAKADAPKATDSSPAPESKPQPKAEAKEEAKAKPAPKVVTPPPGSGDAWEPPADEAP